MEIKEKMELSSNVWQVIGINSKSQQESVVFDTKENAQKYLNEQKHLLTAVEPIKVSVMTLKED
ncbi:hypothetical protein LMHOCYYV_CDS0128 [Staphylococcus phage PG-2021_4]